jgi:hypothetical protein
MMNGNFTFRRFLTDILVCAVIFTIFVLIPFRPARSADTDTTPLITPTSSAQNQQDTPLNEDDKHYRIQQMLHYVRSEVPNLLPGLPSYIRDPAGWALNGARDLRDELDLEHSADGSASMIASLADPIAAMVETPSSTQKEAMWLMPSYHHMGFLPAHDAMVLGFGMRHTMMENRVQVEVRPFFGQNWHGAENYGGSEVAINLNSSDGHPWGKIAVRYVEGDADMLDHGHGTDLHAELRFNDHLALHAGVRQSDNENLGNYVLLRWRLTEFAPIASK